MKTKQHSWKEKEKKKRAQLRGARTHPFHLLLLHPPLLLLTCTHTLSLSTLACTLTHALFLRFNVSRYHILFFVVRLQHLRPFDVFSFSGKKERPFCYKINRSSLTRIFIGRSQTEVRQFVFPNWFFCQFAQILCNEIFTSLNCVAGLLSSSLLLFQARKILILERI